MRPLLGSLLVLPDKAVEKLAMRRERDDNRQLLLDKRVAEILAVEYQQIRFVVYAVQCREDNDAVILGSTVGSSRDKERLGWEMRRLVPILPDGSADVMLDDGLRAVLTVVVEGLHSVAGNIRLICSHACTMHAPCQKEGQ